MTTDLTYELNKRTHLLNLKVWVLIAIFLIIFTLLVLLLLPFCLRKKISRKANENLPVTRIPSISKEIKEIRVDQFSQNHHVQHGNDFLGVPDNFSDKDSEKLLTHLNNEHNKYIDVYSQADSFTDLEKEIATTDSGEKRAGRQVRQTSPSILSGLPEFSKLGWGHWFTLRDLQIATNRFSKENIIGEGGYGIVYSGQLINGSLVAVKRLLNNLGQAEKEFRVEVEAIGHVRHKNLVRLLGYCIEGTQRLLVYEYVNNGNLDQWLHGAMRHHGYLTWEARMKILIGTAKALAYLHDAIEPKVVHRDIKSSNILIDDDFNAKISDFGLAKLLGAGKSHITTRVMGTFGYVAPEYANSGLLNEKSDVYSFGVLLLEAITGRDPVDYSRPAPEVNLVDWLKMMVGSKRSEEVVDPVVERRPSTTALKRTLLTALRCVDPDSNKRPNMSQVVRMLESQEYPIPPEGRRRRKNQEGVSEAESRNSIDTEKSDHTLLKSRKGHPKT
ncbi:hypothetical protein Leryth_016050 [Lithospermum erythrorhizon]|nr:hypothetical protein Leryth_016050 [Lithospermum erythrorhizon]